MLRNFHNVITDGYSIPPKCFFNFHYVITDGYSIPPKCFFNFHNVITDGYSIPPKCFETSSEHSYRVSYKNKITSTFGKKFQKFIVTISFDHCNELPTDEPTIQS